MGPRWPRVSPHPLPPPPPLTQAGTPWGGPCRHLANCHTSTANVKPKAPLRNRRKRLPPPSSNTWASPRLWGSHGIPPHSQGPRKRCCQQACAPSRGSPCTPRKHRAHGLEAAHHQFEQLDLQREWPARERRHLTPTTPCLRNCATWGWGFPDPSEWARVSGEKNAADGGISNTKNNRWHPCPQPVLGRGDAQAATTIVSAVVSMMKM
jgi:hypothetical protein